MDDNNDESVVHKQFAALVNIQDTDVAQVYTYGNPGIWYAILNLW